MWEYIYSKTDASKWLHQEALMKEIWLNHLIFLPLNRHRSLENIATTKIDDFCSPPPFFFLQLSQFGTEMRVFFAIVVTIN